MTKWHGVADEFEYTCLRCQRDDLVATDAEIASPRFTIATQDRINQVEHLFHDCVLSQVVIPFSLKL
jgi:hypothetical protein